MLSIKRLSLYALLALGITFAALGTVVAQTAAEGIKNVVLVHGAFADGSSWSKVVAQLQAKGYKVIAVQNPLTSFSDDVDATKRAIAQMEGPVLLVTHSYRAIVISESGKDPKVPAYLTLLHRFHEEGQNVNDVNAAMPLTGVEPAFQSSPDDCLSLSLKAHQ